MTTPTIIGIAGGSGAGKTTLAKALVDRCNGRALLISHDRYYQFMPCGNYDLPEALEADFMIAHLERLRSGHSADLPVYDMISNSRKEETELVHPHPIIIVEGIFVLTLPQILECLDLKVYVETPDDLRMNRRIVRDAKEKLRSESSVIKRDYARLDGEGTYEEKQAVEGLVKGCREQNNTGLPSYIAERVFGNCRPLFKAPLEKAKLSSADLRSADLRSADLRSTNLSSTILLNTDLRETRNLTSSQLEGKEPPLICNLSLIHI